MEPLPPSAAVDSSPGGKGHPGLARDCFERFPKDRYETSVESWRHLQCDNYEFTMKRLREPKAKPEWPPRQNVPGAHFITNDT